MCTGFVSTPCEVSVFLLQLCCGWSPYTGAPLRIEEVGLITHPAGNGLSLLKCVQVKVFELHWHRPELSFWMVLLNLGCVEHVSEQMMQLEIASATH